jgi:hypothetical protein
VDSEGRPAPVHCRVWLFLVFGVLVGGGLAIDRTSQGDDPQGALAGFVCLGSLSGIAWSLNVRS